MKMIKTQLGAFGLTALLFIAYAWGAHEDGQPLPVSVPAGYHFAYTTVSGCRVFRGPGIETFRFCSRH